MNWAGGVEVGGGGGGWENSAVVRETFLTEADIAHSHDGLFTLHGYGSISSTVYVQN